MNGKLKYILVSAVSIAIPAFWLMQRPAVVQKPVPAAKIHANKTKAKTKVTFDKASETQNPVKNEPVIKAAVEEPPAPRKFHASNNGVLKKTSFDELPGWDQADAKKSLFAFQKSCNTFLKQDPKHKVGTSHIDLQAGDWRPACKAALSMTSASDDQARDFFEKWFSPVKFEQKRKVRGLFTGYYMPVIPGSLTKTAKFSTPIYGMPKASQKHYTRAQIDNGALKDNAPVIAWISSPVERLSLEIEGSGVIKLPDGNTISLGYAGENGAHYTSVGSVLIKKGILSRDKASKNAIQRYLESHPDTMNSILHQNKSFVYFQVMNKTMALGAQGMALTPGYSLAVDHKIVPLGAPLWLSTKKPLASSEKTTPFQRLMIAQDTGGAIRGLMRGDIYWGSGKQATFLGEHMKTAGRYWMLIPKFALSRLAMKFGVRRS